MSLCPEYRVRLFLSVDLVGSTAFKSGSDVAADALYPEWVESFRQFYQQFPEALDSSYRETKSALSGDDQLINGGPKIWKTIGDEILFCARIISLRHLSCCISSFLTALDNYGRMLENSGVPLDVKGAGWLASFPAENISISVQRGGTSGKAGNQDLLSEEFEDEADKFPFRFDFLGKGLDAGFRIAKNASTDRFTSSAELSFLLAQATLQNMFSGRFTYHGRETFKGVIRNQPYPVVSIDTERNPEKRNIRERERMLTRESEASPLALHDFLLAFMNHENMEIPVLPLDGGDEGMEPPASYRRFRKAWEVGVKENQERDDSIAASENAENEGGDHLSPAITDFAKQISNDVTRSTSRILAEEIDGEIFRAAFRALSSAQSKVSGKKPNGSDGEN